ncbi:MAG: hypothetical protein UZ11_BCD004001691 [Bacteroidetes bacterium OLB11]|nr:MAG: hypothetical protein UZ11_BCD004001691 [Bacteroidetes bacterium OLB11]
MIYIRSQNGTEAKDWRSELLKHQAINIRVAR